MNKKEENTLILIPKTEKYIEYLLQIIIKLPRVEKFSIGTEYKTSMYEMLKDIMTINKISKNQILPYLNKIDANLNTQRIYLRIMKKNKWIDEHKLTYEKLMQAHIKSKKSKGLRKEIIVFNLKQEEYIMWLLEKLKKKHINMEDIQHFM